MTKATFGLIAAIAAVNTVVFLSHIPVVRCAAEVATYDNHNDHRAYYRQCVREERRR